MRISEEENKEIRKKVINTLFCLDKWNANHILVENLICGLPKHMIKKVRIVVYKMIKQGILLSKKTKHGLAASLNTKYKGEIEDMMDQRTFLSL